MGRGEGPGSILRTGNGPCAALIEPCEVKPHRGRLMDGKQKSGEQREKSFYGDHGCRVARVFIRDVPNSICSAVISRKLFNHERNVSWDRHCK